jgi:putative isomerase
MTVGVPEPVSRSWDGTMRWGTERSVHAAVLWNLCQDGDGRLYLPVSRAWVEMIHRMHFPHAVSAGPVIFGWDTALAAVAAVELGVDLVEAVLAPMFEHQRADGMIPQVVVGTLASRRTGPPVVFHALARLHERLLEPRLQRRWYANLVAYYRWLRQNRCQGDSGLYQWGGEEGDDHPLAVPGRVGAALESGMDDSPMWDEVEWDADRRCLAVDCVGFSSLMARAAEVMSLWSADLGFPEDAQAYHGDYLDLVDRINGRLWDEEARIYRNRRWDGWFTPALTPTSFFPLLAGAAPPDRARDLLTHLFNPRGFWGDHVIPSLIPTHHAFDGDGDYWRGRVWPPLNWLCLEGLRRHDSDAAALLLRRSRELARWELTHHGHVHENLSALTGQGEPRPGTYARSCPLYAWGGLMWVP